MTTWTESDGSGLPDQLHALALKGSIDGAWNEDIAQSVFLSREAVFPLDTTSSLSVSFEARKFSRRYRKTGDIVLKTVFTVRAIETRDMLVKEDLPEALHYLLLDVSTDTPDTVITASLGGDDSADQLTEDADDVARYKYQRTLHYRLNENAKVLSCARSEDYYTSEEDEEDEVSSLMDVQQGGLKKQYSNVLNLLSWPDQSNNRTTEYLPSHPDLIELEYEDGKDELLNDLTFLEIVREYALSPEMQKDARIEQRMAIKSILAFLNFEGSYHEVQKLI